ncbi:MAG: GntR family transcriptional regulator [Candidatus Eremiobacteraeota bacterium]|nr:GntR family transcriptional regulator [Candidatus Eremiobacteraeota bacterium]
MAAYRVAPSPEPRYERIRRELAAAIGDGSLRAGAQIPSLPQLCERYAVSSITARRAVLELMKDGLVRQRPGRGIFVAERSRPRHAHVALVSVGFAPEWWRPSSEIFGQLAGGIASSVYVRDATLSVVPVDEAAQAPAALRKLLETQRIDAVLLRTAGDADDALVASLREREIPFVALKRPAPAGGSAVSTDDVAGSEAATSHLLARGHARIGLIVTTVSRAIYEAKIAGYRRAYEKARIPVDERLIVTAERPVQRAGELCAAALLDRAQPPSAIFACSDNLALGVYDAAHKRRLRIPYDLAVVGFDDQDFAAHLNPPLTTLRVSYYELGRRAADLAFEACQGAEPRVILLPVSLVVRDSTQPYARV